MKLQAKRFLFILCFSMLTGGQLLAQEMHIHGTVQDTSDNQPLQHAVAMAVRLNDSLLTAFTRSNANGNFSLKVPVDTYQVILSHPRFGDHTYIFLGSKDNTDFNLNKVTLPAKSVTLSEVTVFGYADPVYFKG